MTGPPLTQEEVQLKLALSKQLTEDTVREVVALLSMSDDDSPLHNVVAHHDGVRIPYVIYPDGRTLSIYALPWARGWSIFVSDTTNDAVFDWRNVKAEFKPMSRPLYVPRNGSGPWLTPPSAIVYAIRDLAQQLDRRRKLVERKARHDANSEPPRTRSAALAL